MNILWTFVLLCFSFSTLACPVRPDHYAYKMNQVQRMEQDPNFPVPTTGVITKKEFYQVVQRVQKAYGPYFEWVGKRLKIQASWNDPELNAYATQVGNISSVYLSGGYARIPYMSRDAYYTVICHELGHHLGGYPHYEDSWASTEGQADYYSTAKCMKVILKFDPENRKLAQSLNIPPQIKALCRQEHKTEDDYYVCLRSVKAAEDYGRMMYFRNTGKNPDNAVSLLFRDNSRVAQTNPRHPEAQCRLDTKFEGALCNINERIYISPVDELQGACHPKKGHRVGFRPTCWFASSL